MSLDIEKIKKRKKARRKRSLSAEIRSGYAMLIVAVIVLNLAVGAAYLMINGQKTVLGYKLKQLQLTNESLKDESKSVESHIVDATAFKTLEKTAQMRKMVEVSNIEYTVGSTRTAKY
ncbi:hypothetical protein HOG48_05205 [Candidatus Peregrinibacteria bacterium]|nr:hypothetical protein [Candidatus Peregrinibacteria bacterium]